MFRLCGVLLALVAVPAFGQTMFKCPDASGKVSFQDSPCANGGGAITVKPSAGTDAKRDAGGKTAQGSAPKAASSDRAASLKASADRMEWERKTRDFGYSIRDTEAALASLKAQMTSEMAAIRADIRTFRSDAAAAAFESQRAAALVSTSTKYQTLIQDTQEELRALREAAALYAKKEPSNR